MKRNRESGFQPTLEALENRLTPACTVSLNATGTVLTITGNNTSNVVRLEQDDATNSLTVWCDGVAQSFASLPITKININLGKGNDELSYGLARNGRFNSTKDVNVTLGNGKDQARFNFDGFAAGPPLQGSLKITLDAGAHNDVLRASFGQTIDGKVTLKAYMQDGDDEIWAGLHGFVTDRGRVRMAVDAGADNDFFRVESVDYGSIPDEVNDLDIARDGSVAVNLLGGTGKDTLLLTFGGEVDGSFGLRADGGADPDRVEIHDFIEAGSTGKVQARVLGGSGKDRLVERVSDNSGGSVALGLLLDGGTEADSWTATPNVTVVNCP